MFMIPEYMFWTNYKPAQFARESSEFQKTETREIIKMFFAVKAPRAKSLSFFFGEAISYSQLKVN